MASPLQAVAPVLPACKVGTGNSRQGLQELWATAATLGVLWRERLREQAVAAAVEVVAVGCCKTRTGLALAPALALAFCSLREAPPLKGTPRKKRRK